MSKVDQLFELCVSGSADEVTKLLKSKKLFFLSSVDVNSKNIEGNTPLFVATQHGQLEVVEALLDCGAEVNERNQLHMTALILAAAMGRADLVELLLKHDANPTAEMESGSTALYLAAETGAEEVVNQLLTYGATVDAAIEDGSTPLYIAAQNGFDTIVENLLNDGANINAQLNSGATPLFTAAVQGHSKVVEVLIKHGAATDVILDNGYTVMDAAKTDEIRNLIQKIDPASAQTEEHEEDAFSGESGTFIDARDDNQYRWVRIGNKIWMADNLRYKCTDYCWPSENIEQTGYFYGRPIMSEACPQGWRAPEKSDYDDLIAEFGGEDEAYNLLIQGGTSGFDAQKAGRRYDDGRITNPEESYFWTLSLDEMGLAWFMKLTDYDEQAALIETWDESLKVNMGASVRCIKR